jgi:uncharacterized cupredoxin-like copper-binding protein
MFTELGQTGPRYFYRPVSIETRSGMVTFQLTNEATTCSCFHNMNIGTEVGGKPLASSPAVPAGDSRPFVVQNLPAGSYMYWCSVDDHAQLGMVGKLTVTP